MVINSILAVQGDSKPPIWFGRVTAIKQDKSAVSVRWMEQRAGKNYYFSNVTAEVSNGAIICNGVEFELVYNLDKIVWRLKTPMKLIQLLHEGQQIPLTVQPPVTSTQRNPKNDITEQVFNSKEDLQQYLQQNAQELY